MKQNRYMLGIVFYEQVVAVSEVENDGGTVEVRRQAEFALPDGVTLENAATVQTQFGAFLKEQGFKARKAAVGISGKNVLSALLKIPPVEDPQMRYETVRIHLERKLQVEMPEIAFDYWNEGAPAGPVLAFTTLKKKAAGVKALLTGVKITPLWLTTTSFGIPFVTGSGIDCNLVEYPQSVEAFLFENGSLKGALTMTKGPAGAVDADLADKVQRQVHRALLTITARRDETVRYTWWTNQPPTHPSESIRQLFGDFKRMDVGPGRRPAGTLCDFAGQLASRRLTSETPPVNFLADRHREKKTMMSRRSVWRIAAGAVAALLLIGVYFYGWYSDRALGARYRQQLESMEANVTAAQQMIDQVGFARQWFMQQPTHLERLRELTLAFPQNSSIWLTSLAADETLNQIITGRATSERAILDVVDTLKSNPLFSDIKLLYIRKMGQETDVMTFAINFQSRGDQ